MNVSYNNKPAIMRRNGRLVLGEIAQKQRVSIDISTTDWWAALVPGKHTLQIVARAENLIDSDKSAEVEFTREAWTISDSVNPRATRLVLGVYNVVNGEIGTLAKSCTINIQPGMIIPTPDTSAMTDGVKFIGWLDDGTFNASDLSMITYGTGINPLSDRYGAVWQSETYSSKDDVPLSMVIDETAKAFATVKFNFVNVPEGTAQIAVYAQRFYPSAYNAFTMRPADAAAGLSTTTNDLTSWTTTMFALKSGTTQVGLGFDFFARDIDANKLGATEQIRVESVSTETTTEDQATFA